MKYKNDIFELTVLAIIFILLGILYGFIKIDTPSIIQVFKGIGGAIAIYLVYLRFKTTDDIQKQSAKHFAIDNEFKSFIESTKLLTDKDSSVESKISALYLLYDLSKIHPKKTGRIIQVINKQLEPLFICIENSCVTKKRIKKLTKYKKGIKGKTLFYEYEYKKLLSLDMNSNSLLQTIKEWRYKGNDTEKLISVSLDIIKKITISTLQKEKKHIDISNTIIFDIDTTFNKNLKFKSVTYPTENLIFFNCIFTDNNDFSKTIYHNCKFINCNLKDVDFSEANLWGTLFSNCNLENVQFNNTECEGVEFKKCNNFKIEQIEMMKFQNKENSNKEYLIIISDENLELDSFKNEDEYKSWKNSNDNS